MANNPKAANTYQTGKVPSRLEVDLKTGGATLYGEEGIFNAFGRPIIATSQPGSPNKWTITDAYVKKYNNLNGTKLSKQEVQKVFTKDLAKQNNVQRAAIINNNATEEDKIRLSKESKIPGVIDPKTKKTPKDTTKTPTIAKTEEQTGDTSSPSSTSTPSNNLDKIENIKETSGTRNDFGNFNYPITRDPTQDIIKFDILKYEKRQVQGATFKDRSSLDSRKSIGSVILPIPGGISDTNSCGWGDDKMDPLKLAAASLALSALGENDTNGGLKGALGDIFSQVKSNNESIKSVIAKQTAAAAIGADANALMSRVGGMIMNPNLELLFQGPSLRPFSFQFKMSPRSADESEMILKIIRFFKQGMAPIRDESRLFLRTPHTFRIKYIQMGKDSENPDNKSKFLNEFKECALMGCSVSYTPEGNYAPYEDGAMSSYQMTLQFKELTPIYNDDYGKDGDLPAAIGF